MAGGLIQFSFDELLLLLFVGGIALMDALLPHVGPFSIFLVTWNCLQYKTV